MEAAEHLRITMVQPNVAWEDPAVNLAHYQAFLSDIEPTDLIVLPEMFATGFSMQPEGLAEEMNGTSMQWMQKLASEHNAAVVGSLIIEEEGKYFNRLIWMQPDGNHEQYDKRHLFSFANEEEHYSAGTDRIIVEWKGWKICPLICYDLRFPAWSRNQSLNHGTAAPVYDLLLFVANWPAARSSAWTNLLEARAHENQSFVVGVNRIGDDGNGIPHSGDSRLFGPKGELLSDFVPYEESVRTYQVSHSSLTAFRNKFTAWKDADDISLFP